MIPRKKILVCGAGHQGLAMAGHLALNGIDVKLWNRSYENIAKIKEDGKIICDGVVCGEAEICDVSTELSDVICDSVLVTTPSTAHKDIAKVLAPYVHKNMVIVLNPGRTFGAIEFERVLKECGVKELPHIAETQTIIYTCRRSGGNKSTIYALKDDVKISSLRADDLDIILDKIPECMRNHLVKEQDYIKTSMSNVGMILHCAPVLMNIGWIESNKADFKYYYDGISETIAEFLEKMDQERIEVAKKVGCDVESVKMWMKRTYKVSGNSLYECIRNNDSYKEIDAPPTLNSRYLYEDIPNGLVPIESLGRELGIETDNISLIISLASSVLNYDFRQVGRRFSLRDIK